MQTNFRGNKFPEIWNITRAAEITLMKCKRLKMTRRLIPSKMHIYESESEVIFVISFGLYLLQCTVPLRFH